MIRVVHGERPDEALVDQVDALGEAVVVRVDEERALDNQNVRKELSKEEIQMLELSANHYSDKPKIYMENLKNETI